MVSIVENEGASLGNSAIAGITDALFGFALGLGAFSLTDFPLWDLYDVFDAIFAKR